MHPIQTKKKMGTIILQLAMKIISSSEEQGQKGMQHYINMCTQRHRIGRG